jgi:hypothetical protein
LCTSFAYRDNGVFVRFRAPHSSEYSELVQVSADSNVVVQLVAVQVIKSLMKQ